VESVVQVTVHDIRVRVGFFDHYKTRLLTKECGDEGVICLMRLWMYAAQYSIKGDLSSMTDDEIEAAAHWPHASGMLVACARHAKFLVGSQLHDWEEHQPWAFNSDKRSLVGRQNANSRYKHKIQRPANGMQAACAVYAPSPTLYVKDKDKRFAPPSVEEVSTYCLERHNAINPQQFVDSYQSKGWMVGSSRMKDWKAAVRTWEQRDKLKPNGTPKGRTVWDEAKDYKGGA
jgi:hypothetical protein